MAEITNVEELVPDDLPFEWQGKTYTIPGDIDTDTTFRINLLLIKLANAEIATLAAKPLSPQHVKALERQRQATNETEKLLLGLFQVNHPELEKLPFGAVGFQAVLARVLAHLGFGVEPTPDPTPATAPNRKARRTSKRSRSSHA